MKVLVTGGTGFVGSSLAQHLAATGANVTICDNNFRGRLDEHMKNMIDQYNMKFVLCDLTKPADFEKLEKDYDEIYHLAAINGTGNFYKIPQKVIRVNILSVVNLLDWVVNNNIKSKLLFSSSSEAYADTPNKSIPTPESVALTIKDVFNERFSYGGSKIAGELLFINYAKSYDLDFRIVRYHNVYGPRMGFEHVMPQMAQRAHERENPFRVFGSDQTRAFCYVEDAAEATCLTMRAKDLRGQVVNIGTDEETKIEDIASIITNMFEYEPRLDSLEAPQGSTPRRCPDITRLVASTGFVPKTPLIEGVSKTIKWYKEYYESLSE